VSQHEKNDFSGKGERRSGEKDPLAIMTQSPTGEELIFSLNCVNIMMLYCAGDPAPAAFGGIRHLSVKYLMRFSLKIGN